MTTEVRVLKREEGERSYHSSVEVIWKEEERIRRRVRQVLFFHKSLLRSQEGAEKAIRQALTGESTEVTTITWEPGTWDPAMPGAE